ncbi:MAG TPA: hypothetical protein VF116_06160 [Ktedonobacterales bacterium]
MSSKSHSQSQGSGARARWAILAMRRGWWIGVLVGVLVVFGAGAQYVRAVRAAPYVATQTLHIALLEPPTASTSAVAVAAANAASIARLLASGGLLASPQLDAAIADRMHADHPALSGVTPGAVAGSLSATHDTGGFVTLRAQWASPTGAEALLRAAEEVLRGGALAGEPAVMALMIPGPPGVALRVDAAGAPSVPAPDAGALIAARGDLIARIGLGVLAGLLAVMAGGMLFTRRSSPLIPLSQRPRE